MLVIDHYPLLKPEDLFASLSGGCIFSKVDLSQVYQQIPLQESSKPLSTINMHQGLYQYNRLPFGIASAPARLKRQWTLSCMVCLVFSAILMTFWCRRWTQCHLKSLDEVF